MSRKRVVAVDDVPDSLDALCELLRGWDYEVDGATDRTQALALTLARRTDLVVTDLSLADGDALDVIRRIKQEDDDVVIVAYTGWAHLEAAARAAGADAFVLKPDVDALERLLAYRRNPRPERTSASVEKTG